MLCCDWSIPAAGMERVRVRMVCSMHSLVGKEWGAELKWVGRLVMGMVWSQ